MPVFPFVPKCCSIIWLEAIVTSFLYSLSHNAQGGAIVAVLFSGLRVTQGKGGHQTVMHCKAIP